MWRDGAAALRAHPLPVDEVFAAGVLAGLAEIPSIGPDLAPVIADVLQTGRASVGMHVAGSFTSLDFHTDLVSSHAPGGAADRPPVALQRPGRTGPDGRSDAAKAQARGSSRDA